MRSALIVPMTRLAIGADAAFQRLTISVCVGSGFVRATRWLVEVVRARLTSPVDLSMNIEVSVTTRPNEPALVTRVGWSAESGRLHT